MKVTYYDAKDNIREGYIEIFLEIAIDNYLDAKVYSEEIIELYPDAINHMDRLFEISKRKYKLEIQGLISLCTFMEAIINEVAIVELGSKKFKEHIDSLSIMGKWLFVPPLAYKNELIASKVYFENLSKLISARNRLVHYRTKARVDGTSAKEDDLFLILKNNLDTLKEMLTDLDTLASDSGRLYSHYQEQLSRMNNK